MLYDPKWNLDQASLALLRAADILESEGWCQNKLCSPHGRCVLGAISYVTSTMADDRYEAVRRLAKYVSISVAAWNDAPGRTREEVVDALRQVARINLSFTPRWLQVVE